MGGVAGLRAIEDQAAQVASVKRAESALIEDPIALAPDDTVDSVKRIRSEQGIGSVLITEGNRLVGVVTKRQLRFTEGSERLRDIMKPLSELSILPKESDKEAAEQMFREDNETDLIPVVDRNGELVGLYTYKDILLRSQFPRASKDERDRLLVGAAVGVERDLEQTFLRVGTLVDSDVDFITVDSAHGHDEAVINHVRMIKRAFSDLDVIAGNVATREATRALIDAGADAIKVGIGPGASCTTRKTTGIGVPQLSAVVLSAFESRGEIPIIADGGMRYSGDVAKAFVAGADSVMMGSVFAGVEESPAETIIIGGRKYKAYYGMGSKRAIEEGAGGRYFDARDGSIVPEGIEGIVPYRGTLSETMEQFKGGIEKTMYYTGSTDLDELRNRAQFVRVSPAAEAESHPHDMTVTKEAPNYSTS